jgi:hypothetical protein
MELGILERISLMNILPVEGDVVTVRILKKLRADLGFTEEELKEYEIKSEDNRVTWKEDGYKADISIGEKATDIIKSAFKKLDREGKIREEMLPLYEMFMGAE